MNQEITKYDDLLSKLENLRFYIKTEEQAGKALIFSKKLREFADMVEEKVKARASELMSDKDIAFIEVGNFEVKKVESTIITEYSPAALIDAFVERDGIKDGLLNVLQFLKVSTSKIEGYIKKGRIEGQFLKTMSVSKKTKPRKGYIKIIEKKNESKHIKSTS